ncbi:hypothetical protein B0H19DRAFT_955724, partial [Mycena capillaripes]
MRLLEGNETPLDSQISFIRDIIAAGQERLDALDAEIRPLKVAPAELARRRDEEAEHILRHRSVLHPIRRVPPELLGEIFALTLPNVDQEMPDWSENIPKSTPWYLGHICRFWRLSAMAYPQLW